MTEQARCRHLSFMAICLFATVLLHVADANAQPAPEVQGSGIQVPEAVVSQFLKLDMDDDELLTEAEYVAMGGQPAVRLTRDFHVFDMDSDGRMSLPEFAGIPYLASEGRPGSLPDAVTLLANVHISKLAEQWEQWDTNGDGELDEKEFNSAKPGHETPGLEMTEMSDWDLDRDGTVTQEEAERLLEIAFGVRAPTGALLREGGKVLDWRMFRGRDPDEDGKIPREEYLRTTSAPPSGESPEEWFQGIDVNDDGFLDLMEFATTHHRSNPATEFLGLDKDLNGRLTPDELEALSPDRRPTARFLFPGFDDDGDGGLSLREYELTPVSNLLASWQNLRDSDHDGRLSLSEFQFASPPALTALSANYFHRLDVDKDGFLSLQEWTFLIDAARAPRDIVFRHLDRDEDGQLTFEEIWEQQPRPQSGEPTNPELESELMRREESFRQADRNNNAALDFEEFLTDAGLEVISPGASSLSRKSEVLTEPFLDSLGLGESSYRLYAILGFNLVLIVGVLLFVLRKPKGP